MLVLQAYVPEADIQAEFPSMDTLLGDCGDTVPPFATVWGDFVEMITDMTAQKSHTEDGNFTPL